MDQTSPLTDATSTEPEMLFTGGRQMKGAAFAQLADGEVLVRGSRKRTEPRNLWHDILMSDEDQVQHRLLFPTSFLSLPNLNLNPISNSNTT